MRIGLTGGMGCGKSTAAKFFEGMGFKRLDCDEIVHDLLQNDLRAISSIRQTFGNGVLKIEGGVDRKALGRVAFSSQANLRQLEAIIHPLVREAWTSEIDSDPDSDWVIEVPLLFEKNLQNRVDFTVCVFCHQDLQVERLERKGIVRTQALARINQQLPLSEKAQRADHVLLNDGSFEFLESQIDCILKRIRS